MMPLDLAKSEGFNYGSPQASPHDRPERRRGCLNWDRSFGANAANLAPRTLGDDGPDDSKLGSSLGLPTALAPQWCLGALAHYRRCS